MSEEKTQRWAGDRLGLPESGSGSLAKMPRRILAIIIDWACASVLSALLFKYESTATLLIFAALQWLFLAALGFSFGMRLAGIGVMRLEGRKPSIWQALIRTLLLCLVIPVAVWDADSRGMHDKLASTVLVNLG